VNILKGRASSFITSKYHIQRPKLISSSHKPSQRYITFHQSTYQKLHQSTHQYHVHHYTSKQFITQYINITYIIIHQSTYQRSPSLIFQESIAAKTGRIFDELDRDEVITLYYSPFYIKIASPFLHKNSITNNPWPPITFNITTITAPNITTSTTNPCATSF